MPKEIEAIRLQSAERMKQLEIEDREREREHQIEREWIEFERERERTKWEREASTPALTPRIVMPKQKPTSGMDSTVVAVGVIGLVLAYLLREQPKPAKPKSSALPAPKVRTQLPPKPPENGSETVL